MTTLGIALALACAAMANLGMLCKHRGRLRGAGDQPSQPAAQRRRAVRLALVDDRLRGRRRRLGPARRRDGGRAALAGPGRDRRRAGADRLPGPALLRPPAQPRASGSASGSPPPASRSSPSRCRTRQENEGYSIATLAGFEAVMVGAGCALFASGILRRGLDLPRRRARARLGPFDRRLQRRDQGAHRGRSAIARRERDGQPVDRARRRSAGSAPSSRSPGGCSSARRSR